MGDLTRKVDKSITRDVVLVIFLSCFLPSQVSPTFTSFTIKAHSPWQSCELSPHSLHEVAVVSQPHDTSKTIKKICRYL